MPSPLSMSPRTQAMQTGNVPSDQAKTMFDQGLSSMAYTVLTSKLPNISPDVVTFKVLDSDPATGKGVGAFVVMRQGHTFFIPVVMAGNQIKPLDILYFKDQNLFLPLSKEWMEQLDKMSLGSMGEGVTAPKTLSTDVDIRNTVIPPTTGRYSYAHDVSRVFDEARNQDQQIKLGFVECLAKSPNRVKTAVAKMFETRPTLLKMAVSHYGISPLTNALRQTTEKVADDYQGKLSRGGALYIADDKTSPREFKEMFGTKSPLAFSGMKVKGYYAQDDRKSVKRTIAIQPYFDLKEPKDSGVYRLFKSEGKPVAALIVPNPICIVHGREHAVPPRNIRFRDAQNAPADPIQGHGSRYRIPGADGRDNHVHVDRFVGITEDGELFDVTKLLGEEVALSHLFGSAVYKKTVGDVSAAGPRRGQKGIFVQVSGSNYHATTPLHIESITESGGVRRIRAYSGCGMKTLVTDPKSSITKLHVFKDSDTVYLPQNYVWLPATKELTQGDFMSSPKEISCWIIDGLHQEGAEKLSAYMSPAVRGEYIIGGKSLRFVPALRKLATEGNISVPDAEAMLKTAEEKGRAEVWALSDVQMGKFASYVQKIAEGEPKPKGGGDQPDPAQQAMDQVMQAQMQAPQGPQPIDMAVAEQMQMLQGQQVALQQQMQMLQMVQQRANMIAGTGGAQGNPAAAAAAMGGPMDPSQMGAGQPMQQPQGQPGQPGAMPPGPPQQPGMAQPPPGGQPQQAAPGMPPQGQPQQGQQPQGQDPNQPQQPPPQAMMNSDDGSVESMQAQVNPQFMEQAGQLNDKGVFDAAALASMAQTPSLKDLVSSYTPNFERALDNLGRVLLTLWMDEDEIKESIGMETYIGVEDNLRTVFKGMGDLILKVNQNALILRGPNEPQFQE